MQTRQVFDGIRYSGGFFAFADYKSGGGGVREQIHILVVLQTYY